MSERESRLKGGVVRLLWLWAVLVAALVAFPATSSAQGQGTANAAAAASKEQQTEARDEFNQGKKAAAAKDYSTAYDHFQHAHELLPTPHTAFWMAYCLDQMGTVQRAIDAYESFLSRSDRNKVGADRVTEAKNRVKQLREKLAQNRKAARTEYAAGKAAVDTGDYAAAYERFKLAHELVPTAHTQYWMAYCLDRQGKADESLPAFEAFLEHPDREQVGNEAIATAESRVRVLKARAAPPSATTDTDATPPPGSTATEAVIPAAMTRQAISKAVDDLELEVRKSHHQLRLLSDTVLSGGTSAGRAQIRFVNDLSGAFRVSEVLFVLDGAVQYKRKDTSGSLAQQEEIPIYTGSIPTGEHTLQVLIKLKGQGEGVFSYLRGYSFEVRSTHSFKVPSGRTLQLDVVAWERGDATTPLDQRPALRFAQKITVGLGQDSGTKKR